MNFQLSTLYCIFFIITATLPIEAGAYPEKTPNDVVNTYFTNLHNENYDTAYNLLSHISRKNASEEALFSYWINKKKNNNGYLYFDILSCKLLPVDIDNPSFCRVVVKLYAMDKEGEEYKLIRYMTLSNESGDWHINWFGGLFNHTQALIHRSQYKKAENILGKIIKLNPYNAMAYQSTAYIGYLQSNDQKMLLNIEKAINLEPMNPMYYNLMGLYNSDVTQNYNLAINNYDKIIQSGFGSKQQLATVYTNMSKIFSIMREYGNAEETLNKVLEINPQDEHAFWFLANTYQEQGKMSKAFDLFIKACDLIDEKEKLGKKVINRNLQGRVFTETAEIALKLEEHDLAEKYAIKALGFNPDNEKAQSILNKSQ